MTAKKRPPVTPRVKLVDGERVRAEHVDFTMGGHHYRYPWIPPGEIWIDRRMTKCDREATVVHEIHEYKLMGDGMDYPAAHKRANDVERRFRYRSCKR